MSNTFEQINQAVINNKSKLNTTNFKDKIMKYNTKQITESINNETLHIY